MKKELIFGALCMVVVSVHADLTAMRAEVDRLKFQQQQMERQHGLNCQCPKCRVARQDVFSAESAYQAALGGKGGAAKRVHKSDCPV